MTGRVKKPTRAESDRKLGAAAASSVRAGYQAIADNIRQGREAAAKFREGQYDMGAVPEDLRQITARMQKLANEFSTTGIEFLNWLVNSFEPLATAAGGLPAHKVKLTVRFSGPKKTHKEGKPLTHSLLRPNSTVQLKDISAEPLRPRQAGKGNPIPIKFQSDVSVEGLVAIVTVPQNQAPGVYSAPVYAKGVEAPIGVLSVEIP
jgi:hypothetical protein